MKIGKAEKKHWVGGLQFSKPGRPGASGRRKRSSEMHPLSLGLVLLHNGQFVTFMILASQFGKENSLLMSYIGIREQGWD